MVLDTSAILAVLLRESQADDLKALINASQSKSVATPTLLECGMVLGSRLGFDKILLLHRFVQIYGIRETEFGASHWLEALEAFRLYGKGRHKAALNFGDCISYATAKLARQPLLCIGNDFVHTDLTMAYTP